MNAMIKQAKMNYYESVFATGKQDACFRVIKELIDRCLEECFLRPAVLKSVINQAINKTSIALLSGPSSEAQKSLA